MLWGEAKSKYSLQKFSLKMPRADFHTFKIPNVLNSLMFKVIFS